MSFGINQSTPALILLPDGLTASLLVNGIVERHFDATEIAETNDEIRTCRIRIPFHSPLLAQITTLNGGHLACECSRYVVRRALEPVIGCA